MITNQVCVGNIPWHILCPIYIGLLIWGKLSQVFFIKPQKIFANMASKDSIVQTKLQHWLYYYYLSLLWTQIHVHLYLSISQLWVLFYIALFTVSYNIVHTNIHYDKTCACCLFKHVSTMHVAYPDITWWILHYIYYIVYVKDIKVFCAVCNNFSRDISYLIFSKMCKGKHLNIRFGRYKWKFLVRV